MALESLIRRHEELDQARLLSLQEELRGRIWTKPACKDLVASGDRLALTGQAWPLLDEILAEQGGLHLTAEERAKVIDGAITSATGYGIIQDLLASDRYTEIMVNGPDHIFVEEEGRLFRAMDAKGNALRFASAADLCNVIEKIVAPLNRRVDESEPMVDARLPDGSRVSAVIPPVSLSGPVLTIRRFPKEPMTFERLVALKSLTPEIVVLLTQLVSARYNVVVSGGTGSGKTTFLNALSLAIGQWERVITVEDAAELRLPATENLVRLETRPANSEGKGRIAIRDLVRSALRMRPDRIIVGEVRGGEALDMLQAMNTGHDGSLTTAHANSAADAISRIETMVLMAGLDLPMPAIRGQIASAVEVIVHLGRLPDHTRRVTQITEVTGEMTPDGRVQTREIFKLQHRDGDQRLVPTGTALLRTEKFERADLPIPPLLRGGGVA